MCFHMFCTHICTHTHLREQTDGRSHGAVRYGVEYGHQSIQRKCFWPNQLSVDLIVRDTEVQKVEELTYTLACVCTSRGKPYVWLKL